MVFATGTPVANTIAETYTMMRYLQPDELKRRGLESFDAWAKTYGEITSGIEQTAAGTYKPVQRFAKFVNLPELGNLFQNVADIRVASEVPEMMAAQPKLVDRQGENKRITVVSPPHDALKDYMADVVKRVDRLGEVDPTEDNMLKISSDARKAAMDVRMVDPSAPHNPDGKIPMVARNVAEVYEQEAKDKGTQLIFLDMGTPKAGEGKDDDKASDSEDLTGEEQQVLTNVYKTLRNELAGRGVPEDQVAFIHDYKTPAAREGLFDQVRAGDVRVLVGSTEKIGVGVNVQDRAAAAHHVDVPWRPRDVEQREGRIIRQGNKVYGPLADEETGASLSPGRGVKLFQYVQEGSFDGFMWQAVETKARAIKSLMKRQQTHRGMSDIDPFILGVAEAKALASGNPLVKRAEELKLKVNTGRMSRAAHKKQVHEARVQSADLEKRMETYRALLPSMEADARHVRSLPEKADFQATIGGAAYDKRPEAAKALEAELKAVKYDPDSSALAPIGVYKGFAVGGVNTDQGYRLVIAHPETQQPYQSAHIERDEVKATGLMARLDNLVKNIPDRERKTRDKLTEGEDSLKLYKEQMAKQFAGAAELDHSERQLRVIQARLADDTETLQEGDDSDLDVMSDYSGPSAPPETTPREAPDGDAIDLREAVEAVRSPEDADSPREVKDALVDVLRKEADEPAGSAGPPVEAPDVPAARDPDAAERPEPVPDVPREGLEDGPALPDPTPEGATEEQVERIKAMAEISGSRFASRMAREADDMTREDAQTAIEELTELIEDTENPRKLEALRELDAPTSPPQPDAGPQPAEDPPVAQATDEKEEAEREVEAARDAFFDNVPDSGPRLDEAIGRLDAAEAAEEEKAERESDTYEPPSGDDEAKTEPEPVEPSDLTLEEIEEEMAYLARKQQGYLPYGSLNEEGQKRREGLQERERAAYREYLEGGDEKEWRDTQAEVTSGLAALYDEGARDKYRPTEEREPEPVEPPSPATDEKEEAEREVEAARDAFFDNVPGSGPRLDEAIGRLDAAEAAEEEKAERESDTYEPPSGDEEAEPEPESVEPPELAHEPPRWPARWTDITVVDEKHLAMLEASLAAVKSSSSYERAMAEDDKPDSRPKHPMHIEDLKNGVEEVSEGFVPASRVMDIVGDLERRIDSAREIVELDARDSEPPDEPHDPKPEPAPVAQATEPETDPDEEPEADEPGFRYVLPSFVTAQYRKPAAKVEPEPDAEPVDEPAKPKRERKKRAPKAEPVTMDAEPADEPAVEEKPKRKRARPKAEKRDPDDQPESKPPVTLDDQLYQGHWKAGIGHLKTDMPERRDGDGDTVVAERQPRKSDEYEKSPLPVPPRLTGKYAAVAAVARRRQASKKRSSTRATARKRETGMKTPSRPPKVKIVTRG